MGLTTHYWYIMIMLCVIGLGMAFFSSPNTHAIFGSVDVRCDYPHLLTSVRISFWIFTALCAVGIGTSLVGPGKGEKPRGATSAAGAASAAATRDE